MKLSVITPVLPSKQDHFAETRANIEQAIKVVEAASISWNIEWLIVIDGPGKITDLEDSPLLQDKRVKILSLQEQEGVSAARNKALSEASGDYLFSLDADDLINISGLIKLLEYINSEQLDWFAHGRVIFNDSKGAHHVDQEKMWPVGIIAENWSLGIRNSFHPNSLTIKANALRQVGGWPEDLEVNEDQALMLFLNNRFVGKQLPIQIIRYRVWDKQTIADKNYLNKKKAAFKLIEQQLNQRRIEAGFKPIKAPPARPSPYKK